MTHYLFSDATGTKLFSEDWKLVDEFRAKGSLYAKYIGNGEWTKEEEKIIAKHDGKIMFIGVKNQKKNNVICTTDPKKREKIIAAQNWQQLREIILSNATDRIKETITPDMVVVRAIRSYEELTASIDRLTKRTRDWCELRMPELSRDFPDNNAFVHELTRNSLQALQKKYPDMKKADIIIKSQAEIIAQVVKARETLDEDIKRRMENIAPNVTAITGHRLGAKLIAAAGTLKNLAFLPASTIQLLGAERALFRHLRDKKQKVPKFGILHEHPLLSSLDRKGRGKAARVIADKISIAAKVDYFKGDFVGDSLMNDIEKRFAQ